MTSPPRTRDRSTDPVTDPPDPATAAPPPARGGTIRDRLIGIIALPVLAVLLLLGYITVIEVSDYRAVTAAGESVSSRSRCRT
ncbi:hypothetical protein GCM10027605_30010 [Micromonospora zhanjiangensis]